MKRHDELMRARDLHRRSREQFAKGHEHGLDALKRHDYRALDDAIAEEASAIATHANALQQLNDVIDRDEDPNKPIDE